MTGSELVHDAILIRYDEWSPKNFDILVDNSERNSDFLYERSISDLEEPDRQEFKEITEQKKIERINVYNSYEVEGNHIRPNTQLDTFYLAWTDYSVAVIGEEKTINQIAGHFR